MKQNYLILVSILLLLSTGSSFLQEGDIQWKLVFDDEFDGPTIDPKKWTVANNQVHVPEEQQIYFARNAYIEDGNLVIQTIYNQTYYAPWNRTYDYESAWLDTQFTQTFLHGRFESRILLPATGLDDPIWPAFWMMGNYSEWPKRGEIDIMEMSSGWYPDLMPHIYGSYHFGPSWPDICFASGTIYPDFNLDLSVYHVYSVEWDELEVKWFVDGNLYKRYVEGGTYPNCREPIQLPTEDQYVILNDAIDNFATPDPLSYPKYMKIDYVRIYQKVLNTNKE